MVADETLLAEEVLLVRHAEENSRGAVAAAEAAAADDFALTDEQLASVGGEAAAGDLLTLVRIKVILEGDAELILQTEGADMETFESSRQKGVGYILKRVRCFAADALERGGDCCA